MPKKKDEYNAHLVSYVWALYFTDFYCVNWQKRALHLNLL